ncbi:DNA replication/repair protein RecF [Thermohalobacter berrensis]|uniref:DNA replication and repair protein RecF n=1 Tax=Thermohalobacter berrensis TaxID=99594 RepID=A0A419T1M0_9FIRM|nr:DNA replication/repair protein RecF [Thermohalobacter berrensis]RKD31367.1 DNA replication protein RecF [Thermohalobacter berrensis]
MHVESIKLINFRNYLKADINLNRKLNIFVGNNGQGKTNLLESIYICAFGKSYRTNKDKELINLSKDKAYIGINLKKNGFNKFVEVKFEQGKSKKVRINKIEVDKISDLFGILNVVIFSPEDLKLIKEGPSERRNFLDTEISQIKPKYRYNISSYNRILRQRNNLLKITQNDKSKLKVLDVWDMQISNIGAEIILSRIKFLNKISKISKNIHSEITNKLEELELKYSPSLDIDVNLDKNEIVKVFRRQLKNLLERDIEKGTTTIGPHRDDIKVLINGIDSRAFGSQGQQRTAALSLKLAEVELIKEEVGEYPVLLLDDVLSELDLNRRKDLISTFKDIQTIITTTDDIELKEVEKYQKSIFYINDGKIKPVE